MVAILLMLLATAGIVIFFIKTGKAGKSSAAEIVLSRAWLNRFARQELEEKKLDYLSAYDTVSYTHLTLPTRSAV